MQETLSQFRFAALAVLLPTSTWQLDIGSLAKELYVPRVQFSPTLLLKS